MDSDENCNEVMKVVIELKKKKLQGKSNVACCSEGNGISTNFMTNGKELGGFAEEENRNILSLQQVRNKGRPPCKRKTSKIEKICRNMKEKNGKKKLDYQQTMKDSGVVESGEIVDAKNEHVLKCWYIRQMEYSSDEESDFSDSVIIEYAEKPYEDLKAGKHKVKVNGTLRCPFCSGKKKQDYKFKDLLQHASGVGKGSSNRSAKQKANHFALAKYLENDLASEVDPSQVLHLPQPPQPVKKTPEQEELYV
ncbi:hypothetical protein LWI28_008975 [Acer negundo]|uniref:Zinc finger-XS domain-containing protein n=1 Tax=Acer negundo TaxID=4023 RepID=A0AAD5I9L7_ACENE|nr:hypothetical protein LWI28_008975 [Acer negundo]